MDKEPTATTYFSKSNFMIIRLCVSVFLSPPSKLFLRNNFVHIYFSHQTRNMLNTDSYSDSLSSKLAHYKHSNTDNFQNTLYQDMVLKQGAFTDTVPSKAYAED